MKMYIYKIFHEYQIGDQSVTFMSYIAPDHMRDLLAALQFYFEEHIDEDETLCERAMTEIIDEYSGVEYVDDPGYVIVINTHFNREERAGRAKELMERLNRPDLLRLMKKQQAKELARLKREIPELKEDSQ